MTWGSSGIAIAAAFACVASALADGGSEGAAKPSVSTVQAGDSLFEHLDVLQVTAYPASNLPPALEPEMRKPFKTRLRRLGAGDWAPAEMPTDLVTRLGATTKLRSWRARPEIALAAEAARPRILVGPREASGRMAVATTASGPFIWWEAGSKTLGAVAESAPENVILEYLADPVGELGKLELGLRAGADATQPPRPNDLVRRVTRANVTRTALLLPAGGTLSLSIGNVAADELRVAVALDGAGWKKQQDRFERVQKASDGAVVAVDAIVGGKRQRLWWRALTPADFAAGFLDARASLKPLRGRAAELRLVTEPGGKADASFDYVLWADLTFADPGSGPPPRPHVVLIDIDTLRADGLSLYGARNPTSPHLDRWAGRHATIYRDVLATASWTLPSTTSILTGTYVQQHGVSDSSASTIGAVPMLQTYLKQAGYETWGFADGGYLGPSFGFADGFDRYECEWNHELDWSMALTHVRERRSGRPVFLFLHTYVVHAPYACDPRFEAGREEYRGPLAGAPVDANNVFDPFARRSLELAPREREYIRNLYDAGVARMDEKLARFLVAVERVLQGEDWMLVLTSDHGECFFEHESLAHGQTLYAEVMRVPLLIVWPRSAASPPPKGFCEQPVSSVDIVPTIFDCVGLPIPETLPGRSLLAAADAELRPRLGAQGGDQQSISHAGWRLIRRGAAEPYTLELFDAVNDPFEKRNLAAAEPERVKDLLDLLERMQRRYPRVEGTATGDAALSADAIAGLRALGYIK